MVFIKYKSGGLVIDETCYNNNTSGGFNFNCGRGRYVWPLQKSLTCDRMIELAGIIKI
jgi:hypothetical protein